MAIALTVGSTASKNTGTNLDVPYPSSVAVGDELIIHFTDAVGSISTPSGWTLTESTSRTGLFGYVWTKIAASGDVGQSVFAVTTSNGASGAVMYRITGHDASSPIGAHASGNAAADNFSIAGVTPAKIQSQILILTSCKTSGVSTTGSYAIATTTPTFTEVYDFQWNTNTFSMSGASGPRTPATATGNFSAAGTNASNILGFLIVVSPADQSATATPSALSLSVGQPVPDLASSSTVLPSAQSLTTSQPTPTASQTSTAAFSNETKTSVNWTNETKP